MLNISLFSTFYLYFTDCYKTNTFFFT